MQVEEKFSLFNKILCDKHKKKIIGVVIDNNISEKLICLSCGQERKLPDDIVDKDDFTKLVNEKITLLTSIHQQWIQLNKQFQQSIQNLILRITIDFKDKQEFVNLINACDTKNNKEFQTCFEKIQKIVEELQGTKTKETEKRMSSQNYVMQKIQQGVISQNQEDNTSQIKNFQQNQPQQYNQIQQKQPQVRVQIGPNSNNYRKF